MRHVRIALYVITYYASEVRDAMRYLVARYLEIRQLNVAIVKIGGRHSSALRCFLYAAADTRRVCGHTTTSQES